MSSAKIIPMFQTNVAPGAKEKVAQVLDSGMIGEGRFVKDFTEQLKLLWHNNNVVCLNSCTSALTLALRLAGVVHGNTVLASPFTMCATNCAIKAAGADILWGPIDARTMCMDLDLVVQKLQDAQMSRVQAIVITLVAGIVPYNLDTFLERAAQHGIPVILDAAHAFMTTYKGRHISHWADYCCFSFQSIKHLTTGDGGAITCSRNWDYKRAEKLKWFGMTRDVPPDVDRLTHQMTATINEWGYKYHLNDIGAAIGLANFQTALDSVRASRENACYIQESMKPFVHKDIGLLSPPPDCNPSWWVYGLWVDQSKQRMMIDELNAMGIVATPMWPSNTIHPCFQSNASMKEWLEESDYDPFNIKDNPFTHMTHANNTLTWAPLFVPSGFWLTAEDREFVVQQLQRVINL